MLLYRLFCFTKFTFITCKKKFIYLFQGNKENTAKPYIFFYYVPYHTMKKMAAMSKKTAAKIHVEENC